MLQTHTTSLCYTGLYLRINARAMVAWITLCDGQE